MTVVLALSQSPGPLCPNLKTLRWTDTDENHVPLLQSLLTPSLADLTLPDFVLWSPEISMQLISTCPSLTNLLIQGYGIPDAKDMILLERLSQLHSLEFFKCHALDEAAITTLSSLPSLVELSVELREILQLQHPRPSLKPPTFKSLETLTLELADNKLSILTSLLEPIRFKPRSVSFSMRRLPSPDMLHLLFVALVNACDSQQLSYISLRILARHWLSGIDRHQISLSTLDPLLAFPNVESFTLDAMCNISLDDDAIDALRNTGPS
ncbi:hypothetical protein JVU11DRAFT_2853 [Chiua virens]|nr:hypothetical protein JVU11DRAFT_2853 [Chiua virens]